MPVIGLLTSRASSDVPQLLSAIRQGLKETGFVETQNSIYFHAVFAREGGLFAYGPDNVDLFRRAASYVDRVLHGANPRELPVQVPIKFEQAINLKTAKALGLTVPLTLQASADEVIE